MGTRILVAACLSMAMASVAPAGIMIQLGGLDIGYNGTNITDAGAMDPDPLTNATFLVNNVLVGADTSGVTLGLDIPGVLNIPVIGGTVNSAANGSLYLDLGSGEYLSLTLGSAVVSYIPLTSTIQFVFAGASSSIAGQQLPYSLAMVNPVSVSFSTQITPGSLTQSGSYVTGFHATGTGEVQAIPEPGTLSLLALGGVAVLRRRRK